MGLIPSNPFQSPESAFSMAYNLGIGQFSEIVSFFKTIYDFLKELLGDKEPPWIITIWDELPEEHGQPGSRGKDHNAPYEPIAGMYPLEDLEITKSNVTVETAIFGNESSIKMVGSGVSTFSFTARFEPRHNGIDLRKIQRQADLLNSYDPTLRRKPILQFIRPGEIIPCILDSYTYREGEPYKATGNPTWIEINFAFKVYNPRPPKDSPDPNEPPPSTAYHSLRGGEDVEMVAWIRYGDPRLGIALRHVNAEIIEESSGDVIKVPPSDHPDVAGKTGLQSLIFTDSEFYDVLEEFALDREDKGQGIDWQEDLIGV